MQTDFDCAEWEIKTLSDYGVLEIFHVPKPNEIAAAFDEGVVCACCLSCAQGSLPRWRDDRKPTRCRAAYYSS